MMDQKKGKKTLEKDDKVLYLATPSDFPFPGCLDEGAIFLNRFVWLLYATEIVIIK